MPSKITMYKLSCTVAAGETTASVNSAVMRGRIIAIKTVLNNTTPASSSDRDINIYEMNPFDDDDTTDAIQEILNIGNVGAAPADDNAVYYPRTACQDNTGTDLLYLSTDSAVVPTEFMIFGRLHLAVTAAAAGDITTAYIMVEEY